MNRKKKNCKTAASLAVRTASAEQHDSSDCKRGAVSKGSLDSVLSKISWTTEAFQSRPSQTMTSVRTKWPLVLFFFCFFLILESSSRLDRASSPKRSLLAAHFTLCIESDVQNQHRTVPIKQL